jgi:hypothetical protein
MEKRGLSNITLREFTLDRKKDYTPFRSILAPINEKNIKKILKMLVKNPEMG